MRQLRAPPIRQTATTTGADCQGTRETGRNAPPLSEMQENLQEKAFPCVLHTIMPTETIGTAAASCKIDAKMQDSSPRATPASCGGHRLPSIRGEVYNSEGQKVSAARRNSPLRIHVPFRVFHMAISTQNADAASYRQVRGRGVVLKPGRKKRNGQKAEAEK